MVKVSVIMANYNGEKFIRDAINSVINQSLSEWELLIIDDESTDCSRTIIKDYNDNRIKLLQTDKNSGPAVSRNIGLCNAKGKYVAILDSDDVMYKERLEMQFKHMEENLDIDVLGAAAEYFGGSKTIIVTPYLENEMIKAKIIFDSPFTHSSVMIRRSTLERYNIKYNESFPKAQDYELWAQLGACKGVKFEALDRVLIKYRIHDKQITTLQKGTQKDYANNIRKRQIKLLLNNISESDLDWFCNNISTHSVMKIEDLLKFEKYMINIIFNNSGRYNDDSLKRLCSQIFRHQCILNLINKHGSGKYYWNSKLRQYDNISKVTFLKMKVAGIISKFSRGKHSHD